MPVHLGASGKLKGKVQGDAVIVTLKPRGIKCRFAVNGMLVSPNSQRVTNSPKAPDRDSDFAPE